ncbi:MAG: flagellar brake protein [Anaerolineae bacterium]
MDAVDVLQPGTEVDIIETSGWNTQTIPSHIVHAVGEALYLTMPVPRDLRMMLTSGKPVTLHIKPGNELCVATSQVLGFTKQSPLRVIVARPRALERVEHRQSTRVPVLIHPEQCEVYSGQSTGGLRINPTIVNIGVGGVLLQHHRRLAKDATVKVQFKLPDGYGPIRVEGRVLRDRTELRADQLVDLVGVMFTRISVEDSAAILSYVLGQGRQANHQEQGGDGQNV